MISSDPLKFANIDVTKPTGIDPKTLPEDKIDTTTITTKDDDTAKRTDEGEDNASDNKSDDQISLHSNEEEVHLDPIQTEHFNKKTLLMEIARYKESGVKTNDLTMKNTFQEIEFEVDRIRDSNKRNQKMMLYRLIVFGTAYLIEKSVGFFTDPNPLKDWAMVIKGKCKEYDQYFEEATKQIIVKTYNKATKQYETRIEDNPNDILRVVHTKPWVGLLSSLALNAFAFALANNISTLRGLAAEAPKSLEKTVETKKEEKKEEKVNLDFLK